MTAMAKFLTPVSDAGIPHHLSGFSGQMGNLGPFQPAEVARIYWLLRRITCNYSYSIEGRWNFTGRFSIEALRSPIDRIVAGENFRFNGSNEELKTVSEFSFRPDQLSTTAGGYSFQVRFSDRLFPDGLFNLTTHPPAAATILDRRNVEFCGRPLEIFLTTSYSIPPTGEIGQLEFTFDFFDPTDLAEDS